VPRLGRVLLGRPLRRTQLLLQIDLELAQLRDAGLDGLVLGLPLGQRLLLVVHQPLGVRHRVQHLLRVLLDALELVVHTLGVPLRLLAVPLQLADLVVARVDLLARVLERDGGLGDLALLGVDLVLDARDLGLLRLEPHAADVEDLVVQCLDLALQLRDRRRSLLQRLLVERDLQHGWVAPG
jgi:hypothetical protein